MFSCRVNAIQNIGKYFTEVVAKKFDIITYNIA